MDGHIGPLKSRTEDEFLKSILDEIKTELRLKPEDITFLVKYVYDPISKTGYYSHLSADIFSEDEPYTDKNREKLNTIYNEISEILKKHSYQDIKDEYDLSILNPNEKRPLNKFLTSIPQYKANFSQGYLGFFYPFCIISGNCYKKNDVKYCTKSSGMFSVKKLRDCGLWLSKGGDPKKSGCIDTKRIEEATDLDGCKYHILSNVENILFPFNKDKSTITIPIIRRGQCNTLIFIQTKNPRLVNDKFIKKYTKKVSEFYDNDFYQSFFTQIEAENNFGKILAKPDILSKIFNIKNIIKNAETGRTEGITIDYYESDKIFELTFDNRNISFSTNTIEPFEEISEETEGFFQHFIDTIEQVKKIKEAFYRKNLRTAIISILVDSYAHNISAHSLSALKWWFEMRSKILEKRFYIDSKEFNPNHDPISDLEGKSELSCAKIFNTILDFFKKSQLPSFGEDHSQQTSKSENNYYETLGLEDSTYNKFYTSLYDYLLSADSEKIINWFSIKEEYKSRKGPNSPSFHPRFPVSIDYALFPLFKFLTDKGAFWSGVTRDKAFGGESKTLYKVLWEDFANNPLYLGTIASSEGINKVNIFLAVKAKNKEGSIEWIQGEFVKINLSIIDYEIKMAANPSLTNEEKNNSIYSFVQLGGYFKRFRKLLDTPEYTVFLPGGIVGEHAIFTIFENTLRNIKHYKDENTIKEIKGNGINFWISIEESTKEEFSDKLFKISTWIGHENTIKSADNNVLLNIIEKSNKSIFDEETGTPQMGGNSQDKACAAMLINNEFISVETKDTERAKIFYPWIQFCVSKTGTLFKDCDYPDRIDDEGLLKKSFNIWKGDNYIHVGADFNVNNENFSRYKIVVIDEERESKKEKQIRSALSSEGVIRIINKSDLNGCESFNCSYFGWINQWNGSLKKHIIEIKENNSTLSYIICGNNKIIYIENRKREIGKNCMTNVHEIAFGHGDIDSIDHCNVRSHGMFWKYFFTSNNIASTTYTTNLGTLNNPFIGESHFLMEFWEIIMTKVVIIDNRIFNKFPKKKQKVFNENLNLFYFEEKKEYLSSINNGSGSPLVLILHLSFIESLGYSESNIYRFIKDDKIIRNLISNDNFKLIIVTGRGRSSWLDKLIEDDTDRQFVNKILSKPVESFVNAASSAISYNDDFDVKYNIIKVIFGS